MRPALVLSILLLGSCRSETIRTPDPVTVVPDLPVPLLAHHAAVVDGDVFVLGGASDDSEGVRFDRFDPSSGNWIRLPDLETPRFFAGVAALDGKLYVGGGVRSDAVFEEYDPGTNTWRRLPDLPTPRNRLRAVACAGRIWMIGGMQATDEGLTDRPTVESYDPARGTWRTEPSLNHARHGHAAVVLDGRILVLGGSDGDGTGEILDPDDGAWREGAAVGRHLLFHEAAALEDRVFVFGSRDDPPIPLDAYDPRADRWERVEEHSISRHRLASVVLGSRVFLLGGENNVGAPHVLGDVASYDARSAAWSGDRGPTGEPDE